MTAPYRDPNPEPGDLLRGLEQPPVWPWFFDTEPTFAEDITPLHAALPAHQPRTTLSQRRGDAPPTPIGAYQSRVSRRYAQKMAWLRRLQDVLGLFWEALFAVGLLIAACLFVAWVAS